MRARPWLLLALALTLGCDDGDDDVVRDPDLDAATAPDAAADGAGLDLALQDLALPDLALQDLGPLDATPDALADYSIPPPPALPPPAACDATEPPVVMAHGFLAAGDTWAAHVARFAANGHCADRYHAFDWNTLAMDADHVAALDAFIDDVRARHRAEQVDLMGHSAGGRLGYDYLADPARAAKVRAYVHTGSFPNEGPPTPAGAATRTLNLWSDGDRAVPGADIPGVDNVRLDGVDHYAVATAPAAFEAVYAFLYGAPPATAARPPAEIPVVAGRVLTLGENTPVAAAVVDLWPLDPATGQRLGDAPRARFISDATGAWGPFAAEPDRPYELHVRPEGARPVRYYRPPFAHSDPLVYLRTLPGPASLAGLLLSQITFSAEGTVMVVFSATRALIHGQDDLRIDGASVLTEALAPADETLIALFVYDQRGDGQPGATNPLFEQFPFLQMLDLPLAADPAAAVEVSLGAQTLRIPRWPADPEGAIIAVFDPTAE